MSFKVVGVDYGDGSTTELHECESQKEARRWMNRYCEREQAGNWEEVQLLDSEGNCVFRWWPK